MKLFFGAGMFKALFDKKAKVRKTIEKLYGQALIHQRNGRLKDYGEIMVKIDELEKSLEGPTSSRSNSSRGSSTEKVAKQLYLYCQSPITVFIMLG